MVFERWARCRWRLADAHRRACSMNIVIVEDEAVIARRLMRLLREIDPHLERVELAADFATASAALAARAGSIVFLDLNLHGKDGFELLRRGLAHGWRTIVVS